MILITGASGNAGGSVLNAAIALRLPVRACTAASKMLGLRQPAASLLQTSVTNEVYCKHWTGLTVCTWYAGQSLNLSNSKLI